MSDDLFKSNPDTANPPADPPKPAASKSRTGKAKPEPSGVAEFVDVPPGDNIDPETLKSGNE